MSDSHLKDVHKHKKLKASSIFSLSEKFSSTNRSTIMIIKMIVMTKMIIKIAIQKITFKATYIAVNILYFLSKVRGVTNVDR